MLRRRRTGAARPVDRAVGWRPVGATQSRPVPAGRGRGGACGPHPALRGRVVPERPGGSAPAGGVHLAAVGWRSALVAVAVLRSKRSSLSGGRPRQRRCPAARIGRRTRVRTSVSRLAERVEEPTHAVPPVLLIATGAPSRRLATFEPRADTDDLAAAQHAGVGVVAEQRTILCQRGSRSCQTVDFAAPLRFKGWRVDRSAQRSAVGRFGPGVCGAPPPGIGWR